MSELKREVNGWGRRAENRQMTDLEAVADSGSLSKFWDAEEPPKVLRLIGLKNEETVLDAGCGSGRYLTRFANYETFVVGVDASSPMLRRAKTRTHKMRNVCLVQADIMNLPFKHDFFHVVSSISVLQHLPSGQSIVTNEEPCENAIKEFRRVTKNKGRIVILFANLYNPNSLINLIVKWFLQKVYKKQIFMYYMTTRKAKTLFEEQGLRVSEIVARGFYFPFRVGNLCIIPQKFVPRYLTLFEPISLMINSRLKFLKTFGHSLLIKALKTRG